MNKKMREIMAKIETKTALAKSYMEDGENKDVDKAKGVLAEIEDLKSEYATAKSIYDLEKEQGTPDVAEIAEKSEGKKETDSIKAFANDARNGFRVKSMNEGTPADGGYTVPEDITTKINEYRDSKASLLSLVRREKVTTNTGARTFKKRSQHTGFSTVGEGGKIGAIATPQFERLTYNISKKAGYLPVTNELLADSDANISNTIIEWFGDESRVTANNGIISIVKGLTAVALTGLDDIKKALNVTLGSAFKATSVIVTNDDGLQYLDTLKDLDDNYVLSVSPADPMKMVLCAGATTVPVIVIPNSDLATVENKIPVFIGDFNEGIIYFDRELLSIKLSDVAVIGDLNAYEEDLTLFRGIERNDVKLRDAKALVNGYITVTAGE